MAVLKEIKEEKRYREKAGKTCINHGLADTNWTHPAGLSGGALTEFFNTLLFQIESQPATS